ncbi:MAG: HAD family phosphatase [Deltaproteobacteria bacterium]|nr:HAD family phosphatase [Deltaproteobacteria bacterium]
MVKTILWDNDGLLVDTEQLYFSATRDVLSEVGVELTLDMFIRISLIHGESAFDLAAEQGVSQETIVKLREKRNRRYAGLLKEGVPILDGVKETLSLLLGKVIMGVVTGSRREHFEIIHQHSELLHYFDLVLTREDYRRSKPDPDPYLTAIKTYGIEREHCLVVEDSERGLAAARTAGIRCIVVPNPLTKKGDFSGAYRVFQTIREVGEEALNLLGQPLKANF